MSSMRSAISSCRHSTRSAEQRWPAESKAEATTSATTCSASAEESTIMRILPAGFGDQRHGLPSDPSRPASCRWISRATSVEPVNITPRTRASATSARADAPSPGSSCSASARHARLDAAARTASRGDQRGFLGRLGEHGIAGRQRGGDLAGEDRQRKIPRADAGHRPERAVRRIVERSRGLRGVIAQEIHRLAHFADARWRRSCRPRARSGRAAPASAPRTDRPRGSRMAARSAGGVSAPGAARRGGAQARHPPAPAWLRAPADDVALIGRVAHGARCAALPAGRPTSRSRRSRPAPSPAPPAGARR